MKSKVKAEEDKPNKESKKIAPIPIHLRTDIVDFTFNISSLY